ncbi:MAG: cydB [Paucimonas sp.]|nr:cydB [Paucimonas sp.]
MTESEYFLPLIWAAVIGLAVAMYIVLDGFDLGLGILFPFFPDELQRDTMMSSVAPFWDGNETWLVLGGVGLLVAFPLAYAIIMPALYLPLVVMLLALIFRGVSFEFRHVAKPHHRSWDRAFAAGSTIAAFAQGLVLGGLLQEIRVVDQRFAGGVLDWLTPFSILCGLGLVAGYALLGATWLVLKTEGETEERARELAPRLLLLLLLFIAAVSIWTPWQLPRIFQRWFSFPHVVFLAPLPLLTALLAFGCWKALKRRARLAPFACATGLFLLAYLGLVASNLPWLVPPSITVWQAAADPSSQLFMLVGTAILLPLILMYTVMVFWVFRARVGHGENYHH